MQISFDDLRPGSHERIMAAFASAGACVNIEDVLPDWGEYDEDFTPTEMALAWEYVDVDVQHPRFSLPAVEAFNAAYYGASDVMYRLNELFHGSSPISG